MAEEPRRLLARNIAVPSQYMTQTFTQTQRAILESILASTAERGGSTQQPTAARTPSNDATSNETESATMDPNILSPILESIGTEIEPFGLESVEDSQADEGDDESMSDDEQQMYLDEFETYDTDLSDTVNRCYGPIGCKLYQQISRAKLFQIRYGAYDFLRKLIEFFLSNLRDNKVEGHEQVARLMACLIPISELKEAVRKQKYKTKEAILLRLLLDLYHIFYSLCKPPPHKLYQKVILPLLIEFYTNITESMLKKVNQQMKRILSKVKSESKNEFLFLPTKCDYLLHYKLRLKEEININEGIDQMYI